MVKSEMKLIIFCSAWMYNKPFSNGWDVFCNPQEPDPNYSRSPKFGKLYIEAIERIKPDFVLAINVGCSEQLFDAMQKPKGPKYITWSTDSYRHTQRCTTSDVHLSSIPGATLKPSDKFVPLFFDHREYPIRMVDRKWKFGLHCRQYPQANQYRQRMVKKIKQALGKQFFVNQTETPPLQYIQEIKQFKYGINVGVYHDGLPNFRSFEYGACGVMPVCQRTPILEHLFEDNIILFDDPSDIKVRTYDPVKLQSYYNEKHSLQARLGHIFKTYFDLEF